MCQGLTSSGGSVDDVQEGQIVLVVAEGKETPLAIGKMTKNDKQIKEIN